MAKIFWIGLALAGALATTSAYAQSANIKSLRGEIGLDESNSAPIVTKQEKPSTGFGRAYRQQPPLIPHKVDGYQVNKNFNKCLSCHEWPQNAQYNAPKVSETHYESRGKETDNVAASRWFCTQCHVTQANAPELVPNAFKNARELDGAFSN